MCARTRRLCPVKRGPKPKVTSRRTTLAFLTGRAHVRDIAALRKQSYGGAHAALQRGIGKLMRDRPQAFPWDNGEVILIADALWLRIKGERVTVYVVLLRLPHESTAYLVSVQPLFGWESGKGWREVIRAFPRCLREYVAAAVIDGNGGLQEAIQEHCGIPPDEPVLMQHCQFHCLAALLHRLGKKAVRVQPDTALCWEFARRMLATADADERLIWRNLLVMAIRLPECPERTRRGIIWFDVAYRRTTVCYDSPSRSIPTTTGTAEAVCRQLRRTFERIRPRSAERLQQACRLFLRRHPQFRCAGWNDTRPQTIPPRL